MTHTKNNRASRRRGELMRDRGSRRISFAIEVKRRLNAQRPDVTRTRADSVGPRDPRYAHPTRTHD
jgi:hypothetical protein